MKDSDRSGDAIGLVVLGLTFVLISWAVISEIENIKHRLDVIERRMK